MNPGCRAFPTHRRVRSAAAGARRRHRQSDVARAGSNHVRIPQVQSFAAARADRNGCRDLPARAWRARPAGRPAPRSVGPLAHGLVGLHLRDVAGHNVVGGSRTRPLGRLPASAGLGERAAARLGAAAARAAAQHVAEARRVHTAPGRPPTSGSGASTAASALADGSPGWDA
jgi:hypothetical protein